MAITTRTVGFSGLSVSRLGLGTMTWGRDTRVDDARGVLRNVRMSEPTAHTAADYNDDPSLSRPLGKLPPVS